MAAILFMVLLGIVHVGHVMMQFDQVTCDSFQLQNGVVTPAQPHGYLDGETVTVTCNQGYELIGKNQITCYDDLGGWDENKPHCVRNIVQCDYPDIQDGSMSRRSTSGDVEEIEHLGEGAIIRPNDVILFECGESSHMVIGNEAHDLGHTHSVTCLSNGVWGGDVPTCKHVTCKSFKLANGKVDPAPPHGYFAGDDVILTCDAGYKLSGKSQLICSTATEGWDAELPICEQIKCVTPDFTNGSIYKVSNDSHRSLLNKTSIIPANTTVYFECLPPLRLRSERNYEHKVLCRPDGEWGEELPTCENVTCKSFPLANGQVAPAQPHGYFDGDNVNVTCDKGYKLSGKSQLTCSTAPEGWDDELPTCEEVTCGTPDFTNGNMYKMSDRTKTLLTKTSVIPANTTVYFQCQPTLRMRAQGILQNYEYEHKVLCRPDGEWGEEVPTCESVACDNIEVPNGQVTPAADGGYFNGAVVNVECDAGYKLAGKAQITCRANGWDNQPGECIELDAPDCLKPQFNNGHMTKTYQEGENTLMEAVKPEDVIHAGDIIEFRCNYGYMMSGRDDSLMQGQVFKAKCGRNGTWDRSLPTCQLFECSTPPITKRLKYTLEGQKATYRCLNDNYELLGPTTLTCRMDLKTWFPHLPTCRRKACPTIRWPEDGQFLRLGRLQNATITAECNDAFTLNGTAHRTCLRNGSWSGEPAVCNSAHNDCPNPGVPDGGLRSGNEFHFGARVTFSCDTNFILLGEARQQCLQAGKWSAPAVKCLGPDEYSDPINAVNRWVDIINNIERDNSEWRVEHQVFFLMDSSGSIRTSEINAQRNFIGNLAHKLPNTKMSWVAFNTTSFLLAERQNTSGIHTAMRQQRIGSAGATNVRRAFRTVKEVLVRAKEINGTKVSIILLLNDHINEGGSLSNAMRMRWARNMRPDLYLVAMGGYINRRDLVDAVSMFEHYSHHNAFFLKHKGDLTDLTTGINTALNP